jgi:hypothetical protein
MSREQIQYELKKRLLEKSNICPYCKSEMKIGSVYSGTPIYWSPSFGEIVPRNKEWLQTLTQSGIPAMKCDNCKTVIVQYGW